MLVKNFKCKVKTFLYNLASVESYQSNLISLLNTAGLESYACCEISSSIVSDIVHFARFFFALVQTVYLAISQIT